eukprot:775970-Amphidinium_carterae.2
MEKASGYGAGNWKFKPHWGRFSAVLVPTSTRSGRSAMLHSTGLNHGSLTCLSPLGVSLTSGQAMRSVIAPFGKSWLRAARVTNCLCGLDDNADGIQIQPLWCPCQRMALALREYVTASRIRGDAAFT